VAKRVGVRKEGHHYLTTIGGVGQTVHTTKEEAQRDAASFRKQIKKGR
jgi:hypothetical protein